jgi:hypothetical protein
MRGTRRTTFTNDKKDANDKKDTDTDKKTDTDTKTAKAAA